MYLTVIQLKIDQRIFLSPSKRKLEINLVQSNYHIEITPRYFFLSSHAVMRDSMFFSEAGNYDRVVIQELLKEIAQTQQVDIGAKQRFKGIYIVSWFSRSSNISCPVVIINEADSLSRDAQAALRRTMEKYMSNMRIILCANSTSRLIAPIKSRCLLMRVAAPSEDEVFTPSKIWTTSMTNDFFPSQMMDVLKHVAKRVGFDLPPEAARKIVLDSEGNLRKALLVLEALKMQS